MSSVKMTIDEAREVIHKFKEERGQDDEQGDLELLVVLVKTIIGMDPEEAEAFMKGAHKRLQEEEKIDPEKIEEALENRKSIYEEIGMTDLLDPEGAIEEIDEAESEEAEE